MYLLDPAVQTPPGFGWGTSTWGASTWNTPRSTSNVTLDPGQWSLDNFGEVLIATIVMVKHLLGMQEQLMQEQLELLHQHLVFLHQQIQQQSRFTLVSDRDRHVFHFGTETTIGSTSTQDPMFIRFSRIKKI